MVLRAMYYAEIWARRSKPLKRPWIGALFKFRSSFVAWGWALRSKQRLFRNTPLVFSDGDAKRWFAAAMRL